MKNDILIPPIGMGTYPLKGTILKKAVFAAAQYGYRLFDTSDNYFNEEDLGKALKYLYENSQITRNDLFLVTKLSDELYEPGTVCGGSNRGIYFWNNSPVMKSYGRDAVEKVVREKVERSLNFLQTDYIDCLLMHWPYPDCFLEIWKAMEKIYLSGKVRVIGACNCRERHLEKIMNNGTIMPMVNQIECSPLNTKSSLIKYCTDHQIKVMVYSPLMNLRCESMKNNLKVKQMSLRYEKSIAQIILRWDVQQGLIPIPKSSNVKRLKSNIEIFDFELTTEDFEILNQLNENFQYMPESCACPGI